MYSVGGDLDRPSPDGVTSLRTSLPVLRSVLGSNSVTEMLSEALLIDQSERRTRTRWLISGCRAVRTMSLIAGHPDRGIAALEEALVLIGDGVKLTHARLFCVGYLIVALARVGRWDEASEMWDATEDLQRRHRSQYSIDQAPSLLAEAVIAAHRSDLDGAGDALDQLEPIIELMSFNVAISTDLAIRAAEVAVMCGRNDQVDRLAAITDCGLSKLVDSGEMSARRQSLRQIKDQLVALTPAEMRVLKQLATHLTLQQIGRHFGEQQLAVAGGVDDQSRPCADLPRVDRGN